MERYLEQLVGDIRNATWKVSPPHEIWEKSGADPDNELELEDISHVEQYVYGDELPISEITGIEQELLPLANQLTEPQQALLASELEKLLNVFHFFPDFPGDYPLNLHYPFLRKIWSESHVPLSFGENHIEFCNYEEENCPFPGYCKSCEEFKAQMKADEEMELRNGKPGDTDWSLTIEDLLPKF
jgi:hypothetical protein